MQRFVILWFMLLWAVPLVSAEDACLSHPNSQGCKAGLPAEEYAHLLTEMERYPAPLVTPLEPNLDQINRYAYWRLKGDSGITLYNAPNGSPIGTLAPGYHLIAAYDYQEGWIEINPGQWVVDDENAYGVRPSRFTGVFLDHELEYPLIWLLEESYPAPYPGAEPDKTLEPLPRYTRASIFATVEVEGWNWYLIAPDHWVKQTEVSRLGWVEKPAEVEGVWVAVDLYEQNMVVYDDETPVFATLVSSGLSRFPTNEGLFQTTNRIPDAPMSGGEGQSDYYRLENVPWSIYFDGRISLHGTYWHDGFGYRQSHGCVNLTISDAYWLYHWTEEQQETFQVYVYSSGEYVE